MTGTRRPAPPGPAPSPTLDRETPMRRSLSLLAVPVLVLGLAACASDSGSGDTATPAPSSSSSSAASDVPLRATGEAQEPQAGFPTVELDQDGRPTVTLPGTEAPTELQVETLIKGDGPVVEDGANVTVQYQGLLWKDGTIFDESWKRGEPTTFGTGQVIPGFAAGIVGQTVGSQTVVVIPPAEGYGEQGAPQAGIAGDDTLVFVIDILAAN
jgi:FKBP-type peptidyl-prolyl cis-trans isomerase